MTLQPDLPAERLVFLDECSISTALVSQYGWAKRGERVRFLAPRYGTRRTLVGAIAMDGRKGLQVLEKGLQVETWSAYVEQVLVPMLRPGDLVVMDNLRTHHNAAGIEMIEAVGAKVLFQPPYSPEFNAIEHCWSWVKWELRRMACRSIDALVESALARWEAVTPRLCQAWIQGCGYASAGQNQLS